MFTLALRTKIEGFCSDCDIYTNLIAFLVIMWINPSMFVLLLQIRINYIFMYR